MSGRVAIIVLNWNGLADTVECLESLKKITYPNHEIIMVDNGSDGDDAGVLEEKFGDHIHLVRNDRNYGYAGGNNIGIKYALANSTPDYVLVLNNDTTVAPDFLDHLISAAEGDAATGIVGPCAYYHSFPDRIYAAGGRVSMRTGQTFHIGMKETDRGQYGTRREVDYLPGCCLLIKRAVIEQAGLFDESYFCYWEESDYCFRAREADYKIVYVPEARIWHKAPVILKAWQKTPAGQKESALYHYYMIRNTFRFMRKHATKAQYRTFLLHLFMYRLWYRTAVCLLYHRDPGLLLGFLRGVRDGLLDSDSGAGHYTR